MKTIEINLYKFNELSESAKKNVIEKERSSSYGFGYIMQESDATERIDTLDAFCEEFGISYKLDEDHCHRFISWHFDDIEDEDATGKYLLRFLNKHYYAIRDKKYYSGHFHKDENGKLSYKHRYSRISYQSGPGCPFTGMCYDCDILDKIFDWYKNPDWDLSIHDLFNDVFHHYMRLWEEEDEYRMSDEAIEDMILNNWEDKYFLSDGTEYDGCIEDAEQYDA